MPTWGMVIDLDKCTGCQACSMACRMENNIPFAGPAEAALGRAKWWHEVLEREILGHYPFLDGQFVPRPCMHCEHPPCVKLCPVAATFKTEDGLVAMDYDICIGCRMCTIGCPYAIRYFNWSAPDFPEPLDRMLNPDVSVRPKGVVEKCTFCVHRLRRAEERAKEEGRELWDAELVNLPACNQVCPAAARYFGDLEDPKSTVSRLARSPRALRLLEELCTEPQVYYLMGE